MEDSVKVPQALSSERFQVGEHVKLQGRVASLERLWKPYTSLCPLSFFHLALPELYFL